MAFTDYIVYFYLLLAILFTIIIMINIRTRTIQANPNEWLLVIKDGKLINAGIGLRVFRKFREIIVTFPSLLNKVSFSAQQVSKEMQGVELSGFILWVVNREGDGPFKAYKHIKDISSDITEDSEINNHLRSMAESIVRHQIANLGITDVITQREMVRNKIRLDIQEVVKGFGIWLETVEITDVTVLSKSLFEDLQTPYRQESHEKAERIRRESNKVMEEEKINTDLEIAKKRSDAESSQSIYEMYKKLEEDKEEEKLFLERLRIEKEKIYHENEIKMIKIAEEKKVEIETDVLMAKREEKRLIHEIKREGIFKQKMEAKNLSNILITENEIIIKNKIMKQSMDALQQKLKIEAKLTPQNINKLILDTVKEIYRDLPISEVKIMNMGQNMGIESFITQIARSISDSQKQFNEN